MPLVVGLLTLGGALSGSSPRATPVHTVSRAPLPASSHPILMIRVSQESSPGAADFDTHILGFVRALQTTGQAADFYMYGKYRPNYGNTIPALSSNMSQVFFVNAVDGLALVVVQNTTNHSEMGYGGEATMQWLLSGGTASVLKADDDGEAWASNGGTVFQGDMAWVQSCTDGIGKMIGFMPYRHQWTNL